MPLKETVIRRLKLSRYLFQLAMQNARSDLDVASSAAVNLLQDAIEIFLLASIEHLNISVGPRTDFPQYLDKINEKIADELPFRRRLIDINKIRVLSKHDGISPNVKEISGYLSDGRKFLEEACAKIFSEDFWSISLIHLLEDRESKTFLLEAEGFLTIGEYEQCLISVRKAFYVEFEKDYDTQKDLSERVGILFGSRAPYYARDKAYIEKHVKNPFDYVVLDHSSVDADLTKEGIDHTTFWNVWRLTPQVYRHKNDDPWLNKHEPDKLQSEGLRERASVALESMVEILLSRQTTRRMAKWVSSDTRYFVSLRQEETTIYEKADKAGPVVGKTPAGVKEINVDYSTPALKGDGTFWYVLYFEKNGPFLAGYILEDDLTFE